MKQAIVFIETVLEIQPEQIQKWSVTVALPVVVIWWWWWWWWCGNNNNNTSHYSPDCRERIWSCTFGSKMPTSRHCLPTVTCPYFKFTGA